MGGKWYRGEPIKVRMGDVLLPPFRGLEKGVGCVYRINFKKGYFYIGSTTCISTRLSEHKGAGIHDQRHPVKRLKMWKNVVSVQILRKGKDMERLRKMENKIVVDIFKGYPCVNMTRKGC